MEGSECVDEEVGVSIGSECVDEDVGVSIVSTLESPEIGVEVIVEGKESEPVESQPEAEQGDDDSNGWHSDDLDDEGDDEYYDDDEKEAEEDSEHEEEKGSELSDVEPQLSTLHEISEHEEDGDVPPAPKTVPVEFLLRRRDVTDSDDEIVDGVEQQPSESTNALAGSDDNNRCDVTDSDDEIVDGVEQQPSELTNALTGSDDNNQCDVTDSDKIGVEQQPSESTNALAGSDDNNQSHVSPTRITRRTSLSRYFSPSSEVEPPKFDSDGEEYGDTAVNDWADLKNTEAPPLDESTTEPSVSVADADSEVVSVLETKLSQSSIENGDAVSLSCSSSDRALRRVSGSKLLLHTTRGPDAAAPKARELKMKVANKEPGLQRRVVGTGFKAAPSPMSLNKLLSPKSPSQEASVASTSVAAIDSAEDTSKISPESDSVTPATPTTEVVTITDSPNDRSKYESDVNDIRKMAKITMARVSGFKYSAAPKSPHNTSPRALKARSGSFSRSSVESAALAEQIAPDVDGRDDSSQPAVLPMHSFDFLDSFDEDEVRIVVTPFSAKLIKYDRRSVVPYKDLVIVNQSKDYQGLNQKFLERYLSRDEFCDIFEMSRDEFRKLPLWKQQKLKKDAKLF